MGTQLLFLVATQEAVSISNQTAQTLIHLNLVFSLGQVYFELPEKSL